MIEGTDLDYILDQTRPLWELMRGSRIFLTGGTGFVGTWLLASFLHANRKLELGASAVVLTRNPDAFRRREPELASSEHVAFLTGSGTDFIPPQGAFPFIIHAATERSFTPDVKRPLGIFEPDLTTTRRVLDFARACGTRRLLFTSSGAVYGKQPSDCTHLSEEYAGAPLTTDTGSAYGHGKRASEFLCAMYAQSSGIDIPIARLFAFVGPGLPLDEGYAVGNFIGDALAERPISIGGDGTPFRSYLYAADLAVWLWTMLFRGVSGRAYNVGSPTALTIAELAQLVASVASSSFPVQIAQRPNPEIPPTRYVPDTHRAETELGLRVLIPVDEGIRRTIAWHRARMLSSQG